MVDIVRKSVQWLNPRLTVVNTYLKRQEHGIIFKSYENGNQIGHFLRKRESLKQCEGCKVLLVLVEPRVIGAYLTWRNCLLSVVGTGVCVATDVSPMPRSSRYHLTRANAANSKRIAISAFRLASCSAISWHDARSKRFLSTSMCATQNAPIQFTINYGHTLFWKYF